MNLHKLFQLQQDLDKRILEEHHLQNESLFQKRF